MAPIGLFRVDAAPFMGVGHLSRCLALGHALRARGARVVFICRDVPGGAQGLVAQQGFEMHTLPALAPPGNLTDTMQWLCCGQAEDAAATQAILRREALLPDWLIVDHYGIHAEWEKCLRAAGRRILVIDDLANRLHDCDLLLDQSLRDDNPYAYRIPEDCVVLLGPKYALLREEFLVARRSCAIRTGEIRRIMVFFGGSDPTRDTLKTLDAVRATGEGGLQTDIVVGSMNPARRLIEDACVRTPGCHFNFQVSDMAVRFARADLAIGAGGTASWERLAVGLPSLVIQQAENQRENVSQLARHGVAINLGSSDSVDSGRIQEALMTLRAQPERLRKMSELAFEMVDATGTDKVGVAMGL